MKTLNTIQTFSKLGKVFSKIAYICCMVGVCGCGVGIVAILVGVETVKLGGVTLHSILEAEAGISTGTIWAAIVVGMILCASEIIVARMAHRYFDNELKAGTPFTMEGAKELMHLGISILWIPIVAAVLSQVAQEVLSQFMENVEKVSLDGFDSVGLGIMCMVISLLCKYGAECRESRENSESHKQ